MELKYLQTFRCIVDEGGFTKAAEKLNYTQSTITFQIGQLEDELSVKLFEKIGRKMRLTKAGEALLPMVDEVIDSVDRLKYAEAEDSLLCGSLRIGAGESLLCGKLPKILGEMTSRVPKAHLLVRSMNCYDIRDGLLDGSLDVGVFYEDVGGLSDKLITAPIGTYRTVAVAAPEVAKSIGDGLCVSGSIAYPFIINEEKCIFRQMLETYMREKNIATSHTVELWSVSTIKELVKSGAGFSFLPEFSVAEEISSGSLAEIKTDMRKTNITAVCAHHKNKWLSPLIKMFEELCENLLSEAQYEN